MAAVRTIDFLPKFFRTGTNSKFLKATLDQMVTEPDLVKLNGYIGRKNAVNYKSTDNYLTENSKQRETYQLEPSIVGKDESGSVNFISGYQDLLSKLQYMGVNTSDQSRLFTNEFYTFDGLIDFDKFVNFSQYYWLPTGPDSVSIYSSVVPFNRDFSIEYDAAMRGVTIDGHGPTLNPTITLARKGTYTFTSPSGSNFWIQTEPGTSGTRASQDNMSTREVLGVTNNGSSSVRFTVPVPNAQDRYLNMRRVAEVDIATTLTFAEVQGKRMDEVLEAIGKSDGYRQIAGKTVIFLTGAHDSEWDPGGVFSLDNGPDVFDFSEPVPEQFRRGVWRISTDISTNAMVELNYVADVGINEKVLIREGVKYSNRELYRHIDGMYYSVPVITAVQDTLYYQDSDNPDVVGIIRLIDAGSSAPINIEDVVGRDRYTSPNGVTFTNGLKVQFDENVIPAAYSRGTYFVEGVGKSIKLVNFDMLITPEAFNKNTAIGYDAITYDSNTLETSLSSPQDPTYITINRSSRDMNAWSRGNRWFHEDVINLTAQYNLNPPIIEQTTRADRPIIEFDADLVLYNHGTVGKRAITLLDTVTTDVNSIVNGKETYMVDGAALVAGQRVIFAAERDETIRNKIFEVTFFTPFTGSTPLIKLIPTDDSDFDVKQNIVVTSGAANGGKSFWFNGATWQLSQQKYSVTQEPLFDVFDRNGISFGNSEKYENTTFSGTKVFSYKRGTGKPDPILGFPLSYRNFDSIGDIVFNNNFGSDNFTYRQDSDTAPVVVPLASGVIHQTNNDSFIPRNMWTKSGDKSIQYQQFSYEYVDSPVFSLDIQPLSSRIIPTLKVFVNNKLLQSHEYVFMAESGNYNLTVLSRLNIDDKVDIYVHSNVASNITSYQTPLNLDNNSVNDEFLAVTLGQMRNHIEQCFHNSLDTAGVFPGSSNMRDIIVKDNPGKILQHSAPLTYANLFLTNNATNFERGLDLARKEYTRFKNKFLELSYTLGDVDPSDIPGATDIVLQEINLHKTPEMPWYRSDMLAYGADKQVITHRIISEMVNSYEISNAFDITAPSNKSVYVYLDGQQLTKGRDYSFGVGFPEVILSDTLERKAGSTLTIFEYENTDGCWVPETPTKLGLYPVFRPTIYVDTSFVEPRTVIKGHDGSVTMAFGDFRDELLLELELRIYNNIKTVYNPDRFDINSILPGKFRKTNVSLNEVNSYLAKSFLKWVGTNRLDYITNTFYTNSDGFTWNYRKFVDVLDGEPLPGGWRGIFRYFFDCETPHLTPWEMLGFSDHPLWWDDTYGPAPYTSGNLVLWEDLEAGRIIKGDRAGVHEEYKRPGLTSILPVNEFGELLSPHEFIVRQYEERNTNLTYIVGDVGPVEAAWRRSSEYAFAVQLAVALAAPARYFGLQLDTHNYVRDTSLDQFVFKDTNARIRQIDIKVNGEEYDNVVYYGSGYINWVADYSRSLGLSAKETIGQAIRNLTVQLSYKMAGFSDKKLLKIYAEQANPNSSNSSVMIPDEDYSLELHKSVPTRRMSYSAVIVTKTAMGWSVEGYDLENPFFTIVPGDANGAKQEVTDGAVTVFKYRGFLPEKSPVPYGTEFYTRQGVADFLFGYERYLISQGFTFNNRSIELNQLMDWTLSVREFLNWSQQGWAPGNILALTPVAGSLTVNTTMCQIDELNDPYIGGRVLDINFRTQSNKELVVTRDDDVNTISLTGGIIGFVELITVQYEHTIVLNNLTVFNDVIYQPALGNRQSRLKIVGKKTGNWLGTLNAPGFILNQDNIPNWQPGHDYRKADLVRYKGQLFVATMNVSAADQFDYTTWSISDYNKIKQGLLPNFANIAQRIENFYNVDDVNLESDTDVLSKGLIGFRSRKYFDDFAMDDTSQIKFYQGFIRDKGSRRAIESLTRAQLDRLSSDISFYEDWAFRVGEYGAIDSTQDIEIILNEANFTNGPAFVTLLDDNARRPLDRIGVKFNELYKRPIGFDPDLFLTTDLVKDQNVEFQTAGPVRAGDADFTLFDIRDYVELKANIDNIGAGTRIWVARDYESQWNIYRVDQTGVQIHTLTNLSNELIRIRANEPHGLYAGEVVLMKNISEIFDGFYQIISTPNLNDLILMFTDADLSGFDQATSLSGYLLKLTSLKLEYAALAADRTPKYGWKDGDKIWAEKTVGDQDWAVYEKRSPWDQSGVLKPTTEQYHENYGSTLVSSTSGDLIYVSATGKQQVYVYRVTGNTRTLLTTILAPSNNNSSFGQSIATGDGKYVAISSVVSGNGVVYVYELDNSAYVLVQTCSITDNETPFTCINRETFGASIAMSEENEWMYIGYPGGSVVYAYSLTTGAGQQTTGAPYLWVHAMRGPDVITVDNGNGNGGGGGSDPYDEYGGGSDPYGSDGSGEYGPAPKTIMVGGQTSTSAVAKNQPLSGFGKIIAITGNGARIAVGAPNARYPGMTKAIGSVYIFDRVVEAHVADGVQDTFPIPKSLDSIVGNLRKVTVDAVEIELSQVLVSTEIKLAFKPAASSVVRFEFDNIFEPLAKLTSGEFEILATFGASLVFSSDGSTLLVGAPLSDGGDSNAIDSGAVFRFVDQGLANNQIQARVRSLPKELFMSSSTLFSAYTAAITDGKTACMIPGARLTISDFPIEMTGVTLDSVVADINAAKIPGVSAMANGGVLVLQKAKTQSFTKLKIGGIASSLLGLNVFVKSQKISNPNLESGARFGTYLAITGDGKKLAISSPAGTTIGEMSFDAGQTKFDDRSTEFSTIYRNSGSVYVYQCLPGGSAKFVPMPARDTPDTDNGGGNGGGGGGGGGTDNTAVIFRDTFTGNGPLSEEHIPEIGNRLCSWGIMNNGRPSEMGYNVASLGGGRLQLPPADPTRENATYMFTVPMSQYRNFQNFQEIKPKLASKSLVRFSLKAEFSLSTSDSSMLMLVCFITGATMYVPEIGYAIPVPISITISNEGSSNLMQVTLIDKSVGSIPVVLKTGSNEKNLLIVNFEQSSNVVEILLNGISIMSTSLNDVNTEIPFALDLRYIFGLMVAGQSSELDLLEITGVESSAPDTDPTPKIQVLVANEYGIIYENGEIVAEKHSIDWGNDPGPGPKPEPEPGTDSLYLSMYSEIIANREEWTAGSESPLRNKNVFIIAKNPEDILAFYQSSDGRVAILDAIKTHNALPMPGYYNFGDMQVTLDSAVFQEHQESPDSGRIWEYVLTVTANYPRGDFGGMNPTGTFASQSWVKITRTANGWVPTWTFNDASTTGLPAFIDANYDYINNNTWLAVDQDDLLG
ncbi:hypothetical protein UFOVP116_405 [uncultured Caudovirales phage]|uniref:Uncharacterized protein n=1 Tax=uncultured Caudovirales phage TaxID=2100421 RepID=A0A6J5L8L4_9CAUD|nr:hypothetical protein UFOVP116_405 [uncultured Caudovirales phage]